MILEGVGSSQTHVPILLDFSTHSDVSVKVSDNDICKLLSEYFGCLSWKDHNELYKISDVHSVGYMIAPFRKLENLQLSPAKRFIV